MFEVKFGFLSMNSVTLFIVVELSVFVIVWVSSDWLEELAVFLNPLLRLLAAITRGKYLRKFLQSLLLSLSSQPVCSIRVPPPMLVAWHLVFSCLLGLWISVDSFLGSPLWLRGCFQALTLLAPFLQFQCVQSIYSSSPNLPWGMGHWTPISWCGDSALKPQTHVQLYTAITCRERLSRVCKLVNSIGRHRPMFL